MADNSSTPARYWPTLIQAVRSARKWSQTRFADELNTSQETVSRWESGTIRPSRRMQERIERLAEGAKISSLGGISHIVRLSPYPMLLCDESDQVVAASPSSGFAEGKSVISQTPAFQHAYFEEFSKALRASGFWEDSGQFRNYAYSNEHHGEFKAVLVSISIHGSIYCVVQAIP